MYLSVHMKARITVAFLGMSRPSSGSAQMLLVGAQSANHNFPLLSHLGHKGSSSQTTHLQRPLTRSAISVSYSDGYNKPASFFSAVHKTTVSIQMYKINSLCFQPSDASLSEPIALLIPAFCSCVCMSVLSSFASQQAPVRTNSKPYWSQPFSKIIEMRASLGCIIESYSTEVPIELLYR